MSSTSVNRRRSQVSLTKPLAPSPAERSPPASAAHPPLTSSPSPRCSPLRQHNSRPFRPFYLDPMSPLLPRWLLEQRRSAGRCAAGRCRSDSAPRTQQFSFLYTRPPSLCFRVVNLFRPFAFHCILPRSCFPLLTRPRLILIVAVPIKPGLVGGRLFEQTSLLSGST